MKKETGGGDCLGGADGAACQKPIHLGLRDAQTIAEDIDGLDLIASDSPKDRAAMHREPL